MLRKKFLIHRRDDVDHGVADGDGVQRGRFHDFITLDGVNHPESHRECTRLKSQIRERAPIMKVKTLTAQLKKASSLSAQTVADRLVALRAERDFSQARLAELAGVDRKTINRIENGHFSPSLDTLTRLSVVLKCRLGDLVDPQRSKR